MKQYAIISRDRHRDDRVYLVKCNEDDLKNILEKIWKDDFGYELPPVVNNFYCGNQSGDYEIEVFEPNLINPL